MSNLLPSGTAAGLAAGESVIYAGTQHALTFASQINKVETLRSEMTFGTLLRGLQVYGSKVLDGTASGTGDRHAGLIMGDVVELGVRTTLPIPPEKVLRGALDEDLEIVVVTGRTKSGKLFYATSEADGGITLWYLQRAIHELMKLADAEE